MDPARTRSGVGDNGAAPAADCDVVPPAAPFPMARAPLGVVINRDHVVGFVACLALVGAAYWFMKKCED